MAKFRYNLRGVVGKDLTKKHIKKFSKNIISYIYENNYSKEIIIGKDNRESSDYVLSLIQSELLLRGIKVFTVGVVTTPQLVFLIQKFKFNIGIMITASHNSKQFNGVKCFDKRGNMIDIHDKEFKNIRIVKYEKIVDVSRYKELYLRRVKDKLNNNKIDCVFDCANGAIIEIVRNVFSKHKIINDDTTGKYVNEDCGTEHLQKLKTICRNNKQIGFAFDGDGDRIVAVDQYGNIVDGDKILYILAKEYLGAGDKVVGTIMSSLALEVALNDLKIELIRENVGAKYVSRRMIEEKLMLGGETCGHIFTAQQNYSDAILVVIELLNILNRTRLEFSDLLKDYPKAYRISNSININEVNNIEDYQQINNDMRVIIRRSNTEDVVRVLVEGTDDKLVKRKYEQIINKL